MREGTCYEVQYRNGDGPWQLLCDRDETRGAAQSRIDVVKHRSRATGTEFRIVKVTREPEVSG